MALTLNNQINPVQLGYHVQEYAMLIMLQVNISYSYITVPV